MKTMVRVSKADVKFGDMMVDRVVWAYCVAAYVLIADWLSPLCVVRANLSQDGMIVERPFSESPVEDKLIAVLATLSMFVVAVPGQYTANNLDDIPYAVLGMIADILRGRGKRFNNDAILAQRDRLLDMVTDILCRNSLYHMHLAAALMQGPLTTNMIETIKDQYANFDDDVA